MEEVKMKGWMNVQGEGRGTLDDLSVYAEEALSELPMVLDTNIG